jgi:RHS repeat-associated protein
MVIKKNAETLETISTNNLTRLYYSIGGISVGMKQVENQIPTLSYFLTDHLGSVVGITNTDGVLIEGTERRYTPFGEVRIGSEELESTDYGFTFQKVVTGSGLMDYKARMYDAFTGRFIQPDTLVPEPGSSQGYNRYTYVKNNPINYSDPSGHSPCLDNEGSGNCGIDPDWKKTIQKKPFNRTDLEVITFSFATQPIKIMEREDSTTDFSGSGDLNTIIRPKWYAKKEDLEKVGPDSIAQAVYDTVETGGNILYILFPHGDQVVSVSIQSNQPYQWGPNLPPRLMDVEVTNNSDNVMNYYLSISGGGTNLTSNISAGPGQTSSFNIPQSYIPSDGYNVFIRATNSCSRACIYAKNTILFQGWSQFYVK